MWKFSSWLTGESEVSFLEESVDFFFAAHLEHWFASWHARVGSVAVFLPFINLNKLA